MTNKFLNYYNEARKNPDQNPKHSAYDSVVKASESLGVPEHKIALSMTHVNKLGINPKSTYNTPLGIYAYPYKWAHNEAKHFKSFARVLPYESTAPYINVFTWKQNANLIDLNGMDHAEYKQALAKIEEALNKLYPTGKMTSKLMERWDEDSKSKALVNTFGGRFWYVTLKVATYLAEDKEYEYDIEYGDDLGFESDGPSSNQHANLELAAKWKRVFGKAKSPSDFEKLSSNQKKQLNAKLDRRLPRKDVTDTKWDKVSTTKGVPVLWNKLFRTMGVDGVLDDGDGIVHNNELHQTVIFNPRAIDKVVRVDNVSRGAAQKFSASNEYHERIIDLLLQGRLTKDIAKQLMSKLSLDFNNGGNLSVDEEELLTNRHHFLNTALYEALSRAAIDSNSIEPVRRVILDYTKNFGDINSDIAKSVLNKHSTVFNSAVFMFPLLKYIDLSDADAAKILWKVLTRISSDIGFSKQEKLNAMNEILGYRNVSSVGVEQDERFKTLIDYIQDLEK